LKANQAWSGQLGQEQTKRDLQLFTAAVLANQKFVDLAQSLQFLSSPTTIFSRTRYST
jgi:hypothetical protein